MFLNTNIFRFLYSHLSSSLLPFQTSVEYSVLHYSFLYSSIGWNTQQLLIAMFITAIVTHILTRITQSCGRRSSSRHLASVPISSSSTSSSSTPSTSSSSSSDASSTSSSSKSSNK